MSGGRSNAAFTELTWTLVKRANDRVSRWEARHRGAYVEDGGTEARGHSIPETVRQSSTDRKKEKRPVKAHVTAKEMGGEVWMKTHEHLQGSLTAIE